MRCQRCQAPISNTLSTCTPCSRFKVDTDQDQMSDAQLKAMYNQSLGISASDELIQLLYRPLPMLLLSIIGYMLICVTLFLMFPGQSWYLTLLIAGFVSALLAYYAAYITILVELLYVDKTAFALCLLGLTSVPFVAFLYKDDIGPKKLRTATGLFALTVLFGILTCAADNGRGVISPVVSMLLEGGEGLYPSSYELPDGNQPDDFEQNDLLEE